MKSTVGRPRRATDEQVAFILKWYAERVAWLAQRPSIRSQRELAQHLGLPKTTVTRIIRNSGHFKQTSPKNREVDKARRRAVLRRLK